MKKYKYCCPNCFQTYLSFYKQDLKCVICGNRLYSRNKCKGGQKNEETSEK